MLWGAWQNCARNAVLWGTVFGTLFVDAVVISEGAEAGVLEAEDKMKQVQAETLV